MTGFKEIVKFHFLHLIGFALFILISFDISEHGHTEVVIFGTFLYLPFVFLLIGYNVLSIVLMNTSLTKLKQKWLIYFMPLLPILMWYLIDNFSITVRFWKLDGCQFWIFIIVWGILNIVMYLSINKK